MKKAFFVGVLVLLASALFAQELEAIYTSEGSVYYVSTASPSYMGQNCGQENYQKNIESTRWMESLGLYSSITPNAKLSRGQLECVQKLLSRYETTRGDTFYMRIMFSRNGRQQFEIFCEFTSNTEFRYWAYSCYSKY